MRPSRRTIWLSLAFIAVFAIGFATSTYLLFINPLSRSAFALNYYSTLGKLDTYIYLQCQLGTSSSCESALQQYVAKLENVRTEDGACSPETATMVAYAKTRLALMAEQRGNSIEAQKLFAAAVVKCSVAFSRPCSIESLRQVVSATNYFVPAGASLSRTGAQSINPPDAAR